MLRSPALPALPYPMENTRMHRPFAAILFDLDGTIYHGTEPVPGAVAFVSALPDRGMKCLFVTNRGSRRPRVVARQLQSMGITCTADQILTSSQALADLLPPGSSTYCIGEDGVTSALTERGVRIESGDGPVDTVVVSADRFVTHAKLVQANRHVAAGAKLYATNGDRVINTEAGVVPEAGPLVAAIENATGVTATMIGKPERPIMDAAFARLDAAAADCLIVGDNLETDIAAGRKVGAHTALILTGVSTRADADRAACRPDMIIEDYIALDAALRPFYPPRHQSDSGA